mgnify:CR=1 FL=1
MDVPKNVLDSCTKILVAVVIMYDCVSNQQTEWNQRIRNSERYLLVVGISLMAPMISFEKSVRA